MKLTGVPAKLLANSFDVVTVAILADLVEQETLTGAEPASEGLRPDVDNPMSEPRAGTTPNHRVDFNIAASRRFGYPNFHVAS